MNDPYNTASELNESHLHMQVINMKLIQTSFSHAGWAWCNLYNELYDVKGTVKGKTISLTLENVGIFIPSIPLVDFLWKKKPNLLSNGYISHLSRQFVHKYTTILTLGLKIKTWKTLFTFVVDIGIVW